MIRQTAATSSHTPQHGRTSLVRHRSRSTWRARKTGTCWTWRASLGQTHRHTMAGHTHPIAGKPRCRAHTLADAAAGATDVRCAQDDTASTLVATDRGLPAAARLGPSPLKDPLPAAAWAGNRHLDRSEPNRDRGPSLRRCARSTTRTAEFGDSPRVSPPTIPGDPAQ